MNKETYIKFPNIKVSRLQDVVDFLDDNNIEYIEEYEENEQLDKYKEIINKIKEYCKENSDRDHGEYDRYRDVLDYINELLEEIE